MVELALVLPLLVLLLGGIVDFGRFYYQQVTMQSVAREGARASALGDPAQTAVDVVIGPNVATATSTTSCAAGAKYAEVTVTMKDAFDFLFLDFGNPGPVSATARMRCGL